jgi:hypothetical protein
VELVEILVDVRPQVVEDTQLYGLVALIQQLELGLLVQVVALEAADQIQVEEQLAQELTVELLDY